MGTHQVSSSYLVCHLWGNLGLEGSFSYENDIVSREGWLCMSVAINFLKYSAFPKPGQNRRGSQLHLQNRNMGMNVARSAFSGG